MHNRIKGKVIHGVKLGPKQYLSAEEETELAEFAIEAASVSKLENKFAKDKGILRKDRITQG